ncbi:MAG: response regulator [Chlorogloeopsis fritschii C42_A2020_084]|uniref:sensor histidine kinase n=1 Tax=Chlorogloeopsis fritschii TaxID=1124 RepID=UPI001A02C092|nr:response regulator [Chlorogloeopsis fritschii]MBF2009156.1 response regulator [Chlorogloeopsis fritschii C42_A2020_084]
MNLAIEEVDKNNHSETILIIDDSPTNIEVLSTTLTNAGYQVLAERNGINGIEKVKNNPPDLILLDVMMPKLDGFETCRLLQTDLSTRDIPIIFITSLSEIEEKIKGLTLGAVDYILKPFQQEEVLVRVKLHLKMRRLNLELDEQKQQLEKRVQERTAELSLTLEQLKKTQLQLIQSEKISSLGQVVTGIAHEVNNPLGLISTNLYYASNYVEELVKLIHLYQKKFPYPGSDIEEKIEAMDLVHILKDVPKLISSMKVGTDSIRSTMQSLQNFSRADGERKKAVDIHEGLEVTLMILQHRLKAKPKRPAIQVIKEYGNLPKIECYPGQLNQVFMNLLINAIESLDESIFVEENAKIIYPQIRITTSIDKQQVTIRIANNGIEIKDLAPNQIFQPFFSLQPQETGNGLGLSISYQIITENHGGTLQYISLSGEGTEFLIQIPPS